MSGRKGSPITYFEVRILNQNRWDILCSKQVVPYLSSLRDRYVSVLHFKRAHIQKVKEALLGGGIGFLVTQARYCEVIHTEIKLWASNIEQGFVEDGIWNGEISKAGFRKRISRLLESKKGRSVRSVHMLYTDIGEWQTHCLVDTRGKKASLLLESYRAEYWVS